jgi:hypothetical protein
MGWPHSGDGQLVFSGSMRVSTRGRCGGRASRFGWRRGSFSGVFPSWAAALDCKAASCASSAGLIGGQRLLEERALLGVHALGLGTELPGLQPCQLERDALDLRVAPLDSLGIGVDARGLRGNVLALLANTPCVRLVVAYKN